MPLALEAGLWGLLSGSALVIGAALTYLVAIPQRIVAGIMAFGSGVLISALSFELMDKAHHAGGLAATAAGFLSGAGIYTAAPSICPAGAVPIASVRAATATSVSGVRLREGGSPSRSEP